MLVTRADDVREAFRDDASLPSGPTYRQPVERIVGRTFISMDDREQLRSDVTRMGLRARVGAHTAQELARELVAIAAAGLTAREVPPEERALLEPLAEIAASGRTRAELLLDVARSSNFDRRAIIDFCKY